MDSKAASPAAADPLVTMLHNVTIGKAQQSAKQADGNGRQDESPVLEFHDAINYLLNAIPLFLEGLRKNDQSRSIVSEPNSAVSDSVSQTGATDYTLGDPDIVPSEPSLLPISSVADRYVRSMMKCLAGYPLYDPNPFCELSNEYMRRGVNVGDVGFVREDGSFDFLFNICASQSGLIDPSNLPYGFSLQTPAHSETKNLEPLPRNTHLFRNPITRTNSGEYICKGSEGAILVLPEGAIQDEVKNILPFEKLAARYGVQWYKYAMFRGRKISNGSLYLVTSFTKCVQWGIAIFDRPCAPRQGLRFDKKRSLPFGKSSSKYRWKGSPAFHTKVSKQWDAANQCVFLRGYKIMIRQDIFDNFYNDQRRGCILTMPSPLPQEGGITMTRQRATRMRGGGGSDLTLKTLTSKGLWSQSMTSTATKSDEDVLHTKFDASLVHPSDLINSALLSQNPGAKVALTHDDVWCNLLRDNFPKLDYTALIQIAQSYQTVVDEHGCISLQPVSDSSNPLDESSRPRQGNETLSSPDNAATIFLVLPCELVERIFLFLDVKSMLTCRLVNREFNEIIQSSTLLQYFLACKAAGVTDNPQSSLSYAERREALEKREDAWRRLKPVFEKTIQVKHQSSSLSTYDLIGGAYFLDDINQRDLHYCHLPSSPQDDPQWTRISGHGPGEAQSGIFLNFVISVYEHDLIINVISSYIGNQADMQRHSLDLVLVKFSTGEYHPLARHPRIHVQVSPEAEPLVMSRLVGDNVALVVHSENGMLYDKLFIFDWKTGNKRLQHEATENAYSDLFFVSPEYLFVPNLVLYHFEVWHIPPSYPDPSPPVQILSLQMPLISPNYFLSNLYCHGEPSPFLYSVPYFPPRPFFPSPENSVIAAYLRFDSFLEIRRTSYTLIMHRSGLLDTVQKWTSPSLVEQQEDLPMWLTNEVAVHSIADPDSGLVGALSKPFSMIPHPRFSLQPDGSTDPFSTSHSSPASHTSPISAVFEFASTSSESSTSSSISRYDFLKVQWADWGPLISRWFQVNGLQAGWVMSSNGQRYALSVPNPLDMRKLMISVVDFNPHNVRRNAKMMARFREGAGHSDNVNDEEGRKIEQLEILDHGGVFMEEVYMGLKCMIYHAPDEYDFDVVLMDEERLVGLKFNIDRGIESIKVLYFG